MLFLGTQRHICCLFLLQSCMLLPRYAQQDVGQHEPGAVFQARWHPLCAVRAAVGSFTGCPPVAGARCL